MKAVWSSEVGHCAEKKKPASSVLTMNFTGHFRAQVNLLGLQLNCATS